MEWQPPWNYSLGVTLDIVLVEGGYNEMDIMRAGYIWKQINTFSQHVMR